MLRILFSSALITLFSFIGYSRSYSLGAIRITRLMKVLLVMILLFGTEKSRAQSPPLCTQTYSNGAYGTLIISSGQVACVPASSTFSGSFLVRSGGHLVVCQGNFVGSVTIDPGGTLWDYPGVNYVGALAVNGTRNSNNANCVTCTTPSINSTTPGSRCGTGVVSLAASSTGGTLRWFDAPSGGNQIGTGSPVNTPSISVSTTYYVEAADGSCVSGRTPVLATVVDAPDAGSDGTLTICEGSTVTNGQLFAALNGNPDGGGGWTPALAGAGVYTYTVIANAPCSPNATATVIVSEQAQPDAGADGTLTICAGSTVTAAALFGALNGNPDGGGGWTPSLAGAGVYTYTVTASNPCTVDAAATVTVSEQAQPDAGIDGALTICAGSTVTSAALFGALNGSPDGGGGWSPALAGAGVYTYTVTASNPCTVDATATVTVSEQAQPDAGTDGTLTICAGSTVTSAALFGALNGSPDGGGGWSPALAGAGVYTYTVTASNPCSVDATATVTVSEQAQPDAGSDGTLTICAGSTLTSAALFGALNGTPDGGGGWTPPLAGAGVYTYTVSASNPCTTDATATVTVSEQAQPNAGTDGTLTICAGSTLTSAALFGALNGTPDGGGGWTPPLAGAGVYTYTVSASNPCTIDATATVTVSEQAQPNAGTDGTLTICAGSTVSSAALFGALTGTPDGTGSWTPALAGAGVYTYTVDAISPCGIDATATVTVSEQAQPDAGIDGVLTICAGSTVTAPALFGALNGSPDATGSWNPALAGAGVYTYTVPAVLPCGIDATSTVTVSEQAQPNAGTDGTLTICEGSTVSEAALFGSLIGTPDATGSWSPALAGAGVYTYTVPAIAPCGTDATSTVTVSEQAQPDAGTDGTLTICAGSTVTSAALFGALTGTPDATGSWTPSLAGAGVYTYTVPAISPCGTDATSIVTVSEQDQPNAGTSGTLTICLGNTVTAEILFAALQGTADSTGSWSPALAGGGVYIYTVPATSPCSTPDTSLITVTERDTPDAGSDGALVICAEDTVTAAQLFAALGGNPNSGGVWSPSLAGAGVYTYTVSATAPCTASASAEITVTEQAQPNAGGDGAITICAGDTVTESLLFAALGASPDVGGTWSPSLAGEAVYVYRVAATSPCGIDDTSIVTVSEQVQPNAGTDGSLIICAGETVTDSILFASLQGTPDSLGTWSPALAGAGVYTYTVAAIAPCGIDATSIVTVTEQAQPNAGSDGVFLICAGDTVAEDSLFASLQGTPDATGTWSPTLAGAGVYTYTVPATSPCGIDATSVVTVTEQDSPEAGDGIDISLCSIAQTIDLNDQLNGADAGGSWSPSDSFDPANDVSGEYVYTVLGGGVCVAQSDSVIVNVTSIPNPDIDPMDDTVNCAEFELPRIEGLNLTGALSYYTSPNGQGNVLAEGTLITSSQTIFIYDSTITSPVCFDEQSFEVTINELPISPAISASGGTCPGDTQTFTVAPFDGDLTVDWSPSSVVSSAVSQSGDQLVLINPSSDFSIEANLTNSLTGCQNLNGATFDVSINQAPVIAAINLPSGLVCPSTSDDGLYQVSADVRDYTSLVWSSVENNVVYDPNDDDTTTAKFLSPGDSVFIILEAFNTNCASSVIDTVALYVDTAYSLDYSINGATVCLEDDATYTAVNTGDVPSSGSIDFVWIQNGNDTISTSASAVVRDLSKGLSLELIVTTDFCNAGSILYDSTEVPYVERPGGELTINGEVSYALEGVVSLTSNELELSDALSASDRVGEELSDPDSWSFFWMNANDSLVIAGNEGMITNSVATDYTPLALAVPPNWSEQYYEVMYYMVTTNGTCSDTSMAVLSVEFDLFVPNVFTPNDDGYFDTWTVENGEKYGPLKVQIFNRWGNLVFNDNDWDNAWLGVNNSGDQLPFGTYFYILEISDDDNTVFRGAVTVLK